MNYSVFNERLVLTICNRYRIIFIFIVLVAITLIVELVYFYRTKSNQGISIWNFLSPKPIFQTRFTAKQQIVGDIIVIILLSAIMIHSVAPSYRDVSNQQYVKVTGQFSRDEYNSKPNLFSYGRVYVETKDRKIGLDLPADWTEEFPAGTCYGTVWYSEETKVILSFEPLEDGPIGR